METPNKPCPFCAGVRTGRTYGDAYVKVWCLGCDGVGPLGKSEEEAIAKWNRRSTDPALVHQCVKCGGTDINVRYDRDGCACLYSDRQRPPGEHLHYCCRTCGYDWTGPCCDQKPTLTTPKDTQQ